MTGPRKPAEPRAAAELALAILAAGCGSSAARPTGPPPARPCVAYTPARSPLPAGNCVYRLYLGSACINEIQWHGRGFAAVHRVNDTSHLP